MKTLVLILAFVLCCPCVVTGEEIAYGLVEEMAKPEEPRSYDSGDLFILEMALADCVLDLHERVKELERSSCECGPHPFGTPIEGGGYISTTGDSG